MRSWFSWPPVKAPNLTFCNDFQPGLLQSSLRTPWCSAPSAAPTQCAAQHPHTFLPSKHSPFPSTLRCPHALVRPPSILQVTFVTGILRLGFWCGYFFLLPGIAHSFRRRSRLSKHCSSLSVPKSSCYCWEHCVTTAPLHALGGISSVLFTCQLNASSSGNPSHTPWPWGAVLRVTQSDSWFPRAVWSHGVLLMCLSFPPGADAMMEGILSSVSCTWFLIINEEITLLLVILIFSSIVNNNWFLSWMTE